MATMVLLGRRKGVAIAILKHHNHAVGEGRAASG